MNNSASHQNSVARLPLSIIIPAYNEEDRLPATLDAFFEWRKTAPFDIELIVVDDGSVDRTCDLVQSYIAKHPDMRLIKETHVGQMNAIFAGFRQARHPYVANMEADCATHPSEYERLSPYLDQFDIVMGSRILRGSLPPIAGKSAFRKVLSFGMSKLFLNLFRCRLHDPQMGFKIYKRDVLNAVLPTLRLKHDGLKSAEILVKAHGMGFNVKEVPVLYTHDDNSRCVPKRPYVVVAKAILALFTMWVESYSQYRQGVMTRSPVYFEPVARLISKFTDTFGSEKVVEKRT